jgi:hypothetical protein
MFPLTLDGIDAAIGALLRLDIFRLGYRTTETCGSRTLPDLLGSDKLCPITT